MGTGRCAVSGTPSCPSGTGSHAPRVMFLDGIRGVFILGFVHICEILKHAWIFALLSAFVVHPR